MSFFAPPPAVTAEVFTRLPDRFRKVRPTAWANANRGGHAIDSFLEGPVFDRAGRLYVTDIPFGRIFITCYRRGLMLLDPDTGAVTPFLETAGSEGFRGVNDLTFARNGDLYFTDQGQTGLQDPTGRVYRLRPSGELTCLVDTIPSPNGIVIDDAMGSLFVAVTRAQQIWRVPLNASGLVAKVGVFAQLHGGLGGPDGIALDAEGCLIVAHTGFGSIWRLSPVAEPLLRVKSPAGISTTNVAYGGPDGATLFITESQTGSILTARMPSPGQTLFSHH